MRKFVFIIVLIVSIVGHAQEVMTIAATIVNAKTGDPVEFVNIGFIEKGIGTVSNSEGNFSLTFDKKVIGKNAALQISSIGFETKLIPFEKLGELTSYLVKLDLHPSETDLGVVVVAATKRQFERLGSGSHSRSEMGYWRNKDALGGELATRIEVRNRNSRIHDLRFNILENESDSLLVRVNIYDYHRNAPGKNLLNKNIYHMISKKKGMDTISLKDHNIIVHDDIIVSLELVQVYGDAIYLAISTTPYGGTAFRRDRSQDRWDSFRGVGLGFELLSSYSEDASNLSEAARFKPGRLSLYWDTSLSMEHRNLKEELEVVSNYIKAISKTQPEIKINVISFSNKINAQKEFEIKKGKNKELLSYLEGTFYNGTANFSEIFQDNEFQAEVALLLSDGNSLGRSLDSRMGIPIFSINSLKEAEHDLLNDLSFISGGHYINLTKILPKDALRYMLAEIDDKETYVSDKEVTDARGLIHGVVYNDSGPIEGALVRVKDTYNEVRSANNGMYRINANIGDVLEIRALGMISKDTLIREQRKIHIPLKPDGNLLDEVVVTGKKNKKALVISPFGEKNPDAVGISMAQTITKDDITANHTDIGQLINWGNGIEAIAQDGLQNYKWRYRKFKYASPALTTYAAIIVDGVVYDQNIPGVKPPDISPQQVEKITFLQTAAAAVAYGGAAAYGAVVIETKGAFRQKNLTEDPKVSLLATDNDYNEALPTIEMATSSAEKSSYLKELESAASFSQAKYIYRKQLKEFEHYPIAYFINAGSYFMKWDEVFALSVFSNILEIAPRSGRALRALAYALEGIDKPEEATRVYEQILILEPDRIQAYLEMAANYKQVGNFKGAFALYMKMYNNQVPNIDFNEVADTVLNEIQHLVAHHRSKIEFELLPKELLALGFKKDIRLVFEWSDVLADFELQFVNPENKFFIYTHSIFSNLEQIQSEVKHGYSNKEFVIDDAEPGKWLINLRYLGDKDPDYPVYLKYTVYKNYGMPNESKVVKAIRLQDYMEKVTLLSFLY